MSPTLIEPDDGDAPLVTVKQPGFGCDIDQWPVAGPEGGGVAMQDDDVLTG